MRGLKVSTNNNLLHGLFSEGRCEAAAEEEEHCALKIWLLSAEIKSLLKAPSVESVLKACQVEHAYTMWKQFFGESGFIGFICDTNCSAHCRGHTKTSSL